MKPKSLAWAIYYHVLASLALPIVMAGSAHATVTMNWATISDPGNAADTSTGFGMVTSTYRVAKEEVTNAQYVEFLNTVDANGINPNGIYNSSMGSDVRGGISFTTGNPNGLKYAAKTNMGNKPVNYVTWFDTVRFANWMHNGQGGGSTETGAYDMTLPTPVRLAGATIFLPSANEWFKAAYYDPVNAGADAGGSADYWLYPTMSDSAPTVGSASAIGNISNPGANVANYNRGSDWNGQDGNLTTVGSAGSTSFFGLFDMGGNVWEWNETAYASGAERGIRGGGFGDVADLLQSSDPNFRAPLAHGVGVATGFRLASIPEPATCSLVLIALVILGCRTSYKDGG